MELPPDAYRAVDVNSWLFFKLSDTRYFFSMISQSNTTLFRAVLSFTYPARVLN